jgi:uncharacterized protein YndB with AHSA1/START domain
MDNPKFVYVTFINSTPENVWNALTRPEFTRKYWFARAVQSDWTVGALVKFITDDGRVELKGEVRAVDPPRLLSYSWNSFSPRPDNPDESSRVTFEISFGYGVTKLTVTHDQFEPNDTIYNDVSGGWPVVLSGLKTLLETGKGLPFTDEE